MPLFGLGLIVAVTRSSPRGRPADRLDWWLPVTAGVASIGPATVAAAIVLLLVSRMHWLPHVLAMSAVAVTLAVSAIGPQAFVIEENLARVLDPGGVAPGGHAGIDLVYGSSLGDDAIPALVRALDVVPAVDAVILRGQLEARALELRHEAEIAGPLSWNLARERALEALQARLPG